MTGALVCLVLQAVTVAVLLKHGDVSTSSGRAIAWWSVVAANLLMVLGALSLMWRKV